MTNLEGYLQHANRLQDALTTVTDYIQDFELSDIEKLVDALRYREDVSLTCFTTKDILDRIQSTFEIDVDNNELLYRIPDEHHDNFFNEIALEVVRKSDWFYSYELVYQDIDTGIDNVVDDLHPILRNMFGEERAKIIEYGDEDD